jgi:protein tyrosine phosphatase (PTP) superfamily phosphohydrolase (DUF442 family)
MRRIGVIFGGRSRGRLASGYFRPAAAALLAIATLAQTGCRMDGCGGCKGLGLGRLVSGVGGAVREVGAKIFHCKSGRIVAAGGDCGCGVEGGPVEYGTPGVIMAPGPIMQGTPSTVVPDISPLESTINPGVIEPAQPTKGVSASPAGNKTSYEAARPQTRGGRVARGPEATRTNYPAGAEAQPAERSAGAAKGAADPSPLDNLPPLDLPSEVTQGSKPKLLGEGNPVPAPSPSVATPATEPSTAPANDSSPPPIPAASQSKAPGIARFVSVAPEVAGGSLPAAEGLDWLASMGYKTLVDLREASEMSPAFIQAVDQRGLRYVPLPISLKTLDAEHLSRFRRELEMTRGLAYFFDGEGARAGALWYADQMASAKVDEATARRQARELGTTDDAWFAAATRLVAGLRPSPTTSAVAKPTETAPPIAPPREAAAKPASDSTQASSAPGIDRFEMPAAVLPPLIPTASATPTPVAPSRWKPIAALALSGLSIPLAFYGRASMGHRVTAARASLAASAPSRRSLPPASGG